ncbi:MAG: rRNA-processing protein FCF1 [Candidatus Methanomarinus sp.]|nr:MAG: rRNA-processing protein FCF1 [ANME-2 cluster archaeon]KAF5427130.1 rRNA-processing protein FCF1 [ANME-2 cluster archaeon]
MIFPIDTCSLIALQYSGYLSTIAETVDIVITKRIHSELEEIGIFTDNDAAAAREILKLLHILTIVKVPQRSTGEEELVEVALQKKCDFIVSDDIRAMPKLKMTNTPTLFSTHLLYYLFRAGMISKEVGLIALEKMRNNRSLKENLIYITGIPMLL